MLDRNVNETGRAVKPLRNLPGEHTVGVMWLAIQPILIDGPGNETADVGVEPPGSWQENPEVVRHRELPLEQVFQGGQAAIAGVRPLDRLAQLHLIAQQYDVLGARPHGHEVGDRHLPRLVHEQVIEPTVGGLATEGVHGSADELRQLLTTKYTLTAIKARHAFRQSFQVGFVSTDLGGIWIQTQRVRSL